MVTKKLIKKLETKNHRIALKTFQHYNSPEMKSYFATIAKKKGGDNTFSYIVLVYKLTRSES